MAPFWNVYANLIRHLWHMQWRDWVGVVKVGGMEEWGANIVWGGLGRHVIIISCSPLLKLPFARRLRRGSGYGSRAQLLLVGLCLSDIVWLSTFYKSNMVIHNSLALLQTAVYRCCTTAVTIPFPFYIIINFVHKYNIVALLVYYSCP